MFSCQAMSKYDLNGVRVKHIPTPNVGYERWLKKNTTSCITDIFYDPGFVFDLLRLHSLHSCAQGSCGSVSLEYMYHWT